MTGRLAGIHLARFASSLSRTGGHICGVRTLGSAFTFSKLLNSSPSAVLSNRYRQLGLCLTKNNSSAHNTEVFALPLSLGVQTALQTGGASKGHASGQNVTRTLEGVRLDEESNQLIVSWEGGLSQTFPYVWLRDNCRCSKCFHPVAMARLTTAHELNIDVTATSVKRSHVGDSVIIQWADGHDSQFPLDWLAAYRFVHSQQDQFLNPKYKLWGADIDLKSFDFGELLDDDRALHDWLTELVIRGIAVVKNSPSKVGQLHRLGERVAFLKPCNYGPTFQVKFKIDPSNTAYTSNALALHTDQPYYIRQPGIQMLHCIEQTESTGGATLFSDGFKVALDLKEVDPEAFRLLTTVQLEFVDLGTDHYGRFHQHARHPTIELDELGEIASIAISDSSRDPMLRVPVDQVKPVYRALNKYCKMLIVPQNVLKYKLEKGDIVTFNNRRALHGRSAFQVTKASGRHLEGGYLEWDEVNSRLRVLAAQLQSKL